MHFMLDHYSSSIKYFELICSFQDGNITTCLCIDCNQKNSDQVEKIVVKKLW
jgi:hypothetical protein